MGRGDRKTVRWAKDRERKKKARAVQKAKARGAERKASRAS